MSLTRKPTKSQQLLDTVKTHGSSVAHDGFKLVQGEISSAANNKMPLYHYTRYMTFTFAFVSYLDDYGMTSGLLAIGNGALSIYQRGLIERQHDWSKITEADWVALRGLKESINDTKEVGKYILWNSFGRFVGSLFAKPKQSESSLIDSPESQERASVTIIDESKKLKNT